jgi:hypothetical protein
MTFAVGGGGGKVFSMFCCSMAFQWETGRREMLENHMSMAIADMYQLFLKLKWPRR